jgi:hypothetical protein
MKNIFYLFRKDKKPVIAAEVNEDEALDLQIEADIEELVADIEAAFSPSMRLFDKNCVPTEALYQEWYEPKLQAFYEQGDNDFLAFNAQVAQEFEEMQNLEILNRAMFSIENPQ